MLTPYDWQEGIGNRAQYIEGKLAQGAPILAISLHSGILVFTFRRRARKIYEIYDRLIFAGLGQQSDVEAVRLAALEFASREGFQRSEADVTIQRVATAMSAPLKRAFGDFGASPLVARSLFAEVGETPEEDLYYILDYDGDFAPARRHAAVAGTLEAGARLDESLKGLDASLSAEEAMARLQEIWRSLESEGDHREDGLTAEAVLLERAGGRVNRFRLLTSEEF
ncbi:hypothetical protein EON79_00910 [bacterium]|nr:MAG: hypothetical protein EON79_00910 [bacterium]